jgi:hypothetical protein
VCIKALLLLERDVDIMNILILGIFAHLPPPDFPFRPNV